MGTVLIVDDNKFQAKLMTRIVEGLGFKVIGVGADGLQGIELYHSLLPDVMLLDITMPNMDGVECLEEIMKKDPNASIVMLSAVREERVVEKCLQLGAARFLSKPSKCDSPEYLALVRETLDCAIAKVCQS